MTIPEVEAYYNSSHEPRVDAVYVASCRCGEEETFISEIEAEEWADVHGSIEE